MRELENSLRSSITPPQITVGTQVIHKVYGAGQVEQTVAEFGIAKAVVNFQNVGLRKVAAAQLAL